MNTQIDSTASFYLDANGLNHLKLQAKQNETDAVRAAAKQFESVFLAMMLKSMREATPQDGIFDSEQTKMYTSMLDQQLALSMSNKGIGLADIMTRQLTGGQKQRVDPIPMGHPLPQPAPAQKASQPAAPLASGMQPAPVAPRMQPAPKAGNSGFVAEMLPHALPASRNSGIPAKFMLGQAALESGWGKHEIVGTDGKKSFNLFGIKAGKNWKGGKVSALTTEYVHGKPRKVYQDFRAYRSYNEAFNDYANLLKKSPRYQEAAKAQNAAGFANGLQQGGYATDPQYANKLTRVLSANALRTAA